MQITEAIKRHLSQDQRLGQVVETLPFPELSPRGPVFVSLLRSIVSQQLSTKAAATIYSRFLDLFPGREPEASVLQRLELDSLRAVGLSRQKAQYVQNVADFFLSNDLKTSDWDQFQDQEVLKMLTGIKGVGRWTAEMVLMFTLHRPDIFPDDDLGIQRAMQGIYGLTDLNGKELKKAMAPIAEVWSPYRTYACVYLWQWKDQ